MPDAMTEIQKINFRSTFPTTRLFRALPAVFDPRKLLVAAAGLLLIAAGDSLLRLLPGIGSLVKQHGTWPWQPNLIENVVPWRLVAEAPLAGLVSVVTQWTVVLAPLELFFGPAWALWGAGLDSLRGLALVFQCLVRILVWGLVGGALVRMTATEFAQDRRTGMMAALRFASGRITASLSAPLLPIAGITVLALLAALLGLIARLPGAGDLLMLLVLALALPLGIGIAFLLIGLAVGWPLMFAAVNVEKGDGFDALGRAYSYLLERPWHAVWYAIVSVATGSLAYHLFAWGLGLASLLAAHSVAWGHGPIVMGSFLQNATARLAALAIGACIVSYFWTAVTLVYFLLRQRSDGTPLDELQSESPPPETNVQALIRPSPLLPIVE